MELLIILMALQFADWWTSAQASHNPRGYEGMRLMTYLMRALGFHWAFVAKIIGVTLLCAILYAIQQTRGLYWQCQAGYLLLIYRYSKICWNNWIIARG